MPHIFCNKNSVYFYVVVATFASRVGQYITYTVINSKRLGNVWTKELSWYKPYIMITFLMSVVVLISEYMIHVFGLHISLFVKLCIQLPLGLLVYVFLAFRFKIDEISLVNSVLSMVTQKIRRNK